MGNIIANFIDRRKKEKQDRIDRIQKRKSLRMSSQDHLSNAVALLSEEGSTKTVPGWSRSLSWLICDAQKGHSWEARGMPSISGCRSCLVIAKQIGEPKKVIDELILAVRDLIELDVYYPEERARDNLFDCSIVLGRAQQLECG